MLLQAAQKGSAAAQYSLGSAAEADGAWDAALNWYRLAANNGYAGAQYRLALMLEAGRGTPMDLTESRRWLEQAAGANFKPAMDKLAGLPPANAATGVAQSGIRYGDLSEPWYSGLVAGASTLLTIVLLLAAAGGLYMLFGRLQASSRSVRVAPPPRPPHSRR